MTVLRLPLWPTVIVLLAVATMIALGIWQLGRAEEKNALIARYSAVQRNPQPVAYPTGAAEANEALYRRSRLECVRVLSITAINGTSAQGAKGWAHRATCR